MSWLPLFALAVSVLGFRPNTRTRRARSPPFETPPYRLFERVRAYYVHGDSADAKEEDGKAKEAVLAVVGMPSVIKSMAKCLIFIPVSSGGPPLVPHHRHHRLHRLLRHHRLPRLPILLLSSSCMEYLDWPFEGDEGSLAHSLICPDESLVCTSRI